MPSGSRLEPRLTRFVTLARTNHDAALAMMGMQLLGFHFVRALNDDAAAWLAKGTALPADAWTISADDLHARLGADDLPVVLDVREPRELERGGWIEGAVNVPLDLLKQSHGGLPSRTQPIVVVCATGVRSLTAARALRAAGYADVRSLDGGMRAWTDAGYPVRKGR